MTAPLPEAQLVETALLAQIAFQTSVASRAARIVQAASGRPVVEFGARRAHGLEAGVFAARAAFLAGCESTSNIEAGRRFGIPVSGTMAHSWVTAFPDEYLRISSVCRGLRRPPGRCCWIPTTRWLPPDQIAASRLRPRAVRLDSGDIIALSRNVRGDPRHSRSS